MPRPRVDPTVIATVLAGMTYPARPWQLLAQADHYGIGGEIRAALGRLPSKIYPSLQAVIDTLDALDRLRRAGPPGQPADHGASRPDSAQ